MRANLLSLSAAIKDGLIPQPVPPTAQWTQEYFRLPPEARGTESDGAYSLQYTPYFYGVFAALDDDAVSEVVMQKAAQIGWTYALIAWLCKNIKWRPSPMVIMFPKEGAAKEFNDEKFEPCVRSTAPIAQLIDVTKSRSSGNRSLFKTFANGFLKLVGSKSISSVKSTPARIVVVEEPDDATDNLKEQGNSIRLLWERTKRQRNAKRVLGGTPSVEGLSKVEDHIRLSDQRVLPIVCNGCGGAHVLNWDNVTWTTADDPAYQAHEVYGAALPETARYACPDCGELWDDYQRRENIRNTVMAAIEEGDPLCGWVPTAPFHGIAGFKELSEIYSCLPGVGLEDLVKDYLAAEYEAGRGDESERIVFVNSKLAKVYAYRGDHVSESDLKERAEAEGFQEGTCPAGGLLLTVGIDVQRNPARVAVVQRAWGRGEESWMIGWQELYAANTTTDKTDRVWDDLERLVFGPVPHESGNAIYASAVSIDSGDGVTNDAVYDWVRRMNKKYPHVLTMAIKGSNSQQDPEIFSTPRLKSIDHKNPKKASKADKYGLKPYIVGVNKAKDWLSGHMKLTGHGPGRFHICTDVRADYFEQVTGEVKAPHRTIRNRKVWQPKSGRAIEAWDCEVYALHAARGKRIHLLSPKDWDNLEQKLLQSDLFSQPEPIDHPAQQTEDQSTIDASTNISAAPVPEKKPRRSMADLGRRASSN